MPWSAAGGAEIIGAGCTMCTHANSVYVFGGMDEERAEHMSTWKWDLSCDEGFQPVTYRRAPCSPTQEGTDTPARGFQIELRA